MTPPPANRGVENTHGGDTLKVQITLDDALMTRIDNYADANYMSRSGLVSLACTQYLNSAEMIQAVSEMCCAIKTIAEKGFVDDETQRKLDEFAILSKMLKAEVS